MLRILAAHEGEKRSDGTLDPWNPVGHLWEGWCLGSVDGTRNEAGIPGPRRENAAALLDAVIAQGLLQTSWPPEHGGVPLWGRQFDPAGHVCLYDADRQQFLSTLYSPSRIGYRDPAGWMEQMAGWFRAPGVVAPYRAVQPPVVTPPAPPADGLVIAGPYGTIAVPEPFAARWRALDAVGLAYPTLGYPTGPVTTMGTGRRLLPFERAVLATGDGAAPWDVASLLLVELMPYAPLPPPSR